MKHSLLIFACIFFFFISCQKEKLPKLTEEGKNTFGCKVNDKNWVPHGTGGIFNSTDPVYGGFYRDINTIYVRAYNGNESIEIYLKNVYSTGEYSLNFTTTPKPDNLYPENYGIYIIENNTTINSFITTSSYTGKVTISNRDTTNKIVSGIFEFTGVDKAGNTARITDGRFDIKSH
ncbi:MAG: hypothetical protein ABJA90_04570 [Ginsengibacter sp.]